MSADIETTPMPVTAVPSGGAERAARAARAAVTGAEVLAAHRGALSVAERRESSAYPSVWWWGAGVRADRRGATASTGRYVVDAHDHLAYRYEVLSQLGFGQYGTVYAAIDHSTGDTVAVKVIRNADRYAASARAEANILRLLGEHSPEEHGCIRVLRHFRFRGHVCIVFPMHHHDLYAELKACGPAGLPVDRVRGIVRNIVRCLGLLREHRVVHADLRPENVILASDTAGSTDVRVIDFGASFFADRANVGPPPYIQSRYWRAPDVVFGCPLGCAIDMWSLGCLVFELSTGRPLFVASSEAELVTMHAEALGPPPAAVLARATLRVHIRTHDTQGRARPPGSRPLARTLGTHTPDLLHFVTRCLAWEPADRLTPAEALDHSFLREQ